MKSRAGAENSNARRTLQLRFADSLASATGKPGISVVQRVPRVPQVPTGPTWVAVGDLHPRHVNFDQIANTPGGQSVWHIVYGTELSGGLAGQTEDVEFQVMDPHGTGAINSVGAFTGYLDGLEGGFIFKSEGVQNADGTFVMDFAIVPGTGYGEIADVAGRYTVVATREHCHPIGDPDTCETLVVSYTLTYRLPQA
ncbi:DUF3224 domain-containing protein [Amycolatopsis sp. NPDC059021]|uniref:DUF3224 domain-containing protein n=1 Tax=Amycolatopsis sp. NPDC059021 TaxID=3346704 RepID=UPI00366EBFB0